MLNPALLLVVASLASAPNAKQKVLVMPLAAGEGVTEGTSAAITAAVVGDVRKRAGLQVLTNTDVQAMLSVERQRQLLGCSESSCLAELGGALGVDRVVTGSVARLGESWLIHVQLLDAGKAVVVAESDRRKKKGNVDDVLDELPGMVGELFGPPAAAQPPVAAMVPAPAPTTAPTPELAAPRAASIPPPSVDEPAQLTAEVRAKLQVVGDGKGHFIAFVPFTGFDAPFFAGTDAALSAQYVAGGGSQGTTEFDLSFWDPRVKRGAESYFEFKDGKYTLTCKDKEIAFSALPPAQAKALLGKAKLLAPRWRRQGIALGRDDDGNYYYVDAPRSDDRSDELHLYLGHKGKVVPVKVTDVQREGAVLLVDSDAGTLKLPLGDDEARKAPGSFKAASGARPVTSLDLWSNRAMIYTALGAYAGSHLGTACDPFLE